MELTLPQWGQLMTLSMIAIALGLDAFSLGIGIGVKGILFRQVVIISTWIGLSHMAMPLLGYVIGGYLSQVFQEIGTLVGGSLFFLLGGHMLLSSLWKGKKSRGIHPQHWIGIIFFSFSVSVDSLSAGLSIGLFRSNLLIAVLLFGFASACMAALGMMLGRTSGDWLGDYSEAIGGTILILLGCKFLW
ncbi:manganese efflux pump MntP family protein [Mechercharimyces sp. CAU 1602]|uniref:manganese efflux pump MntP n=1 Tax=Mechercharimyces sp. CAU 1602 TaxID=2973933 RepID=UPI0021620714|nr:manganese efflux pump MntP family protein [Mechercharimyces sp. CAU 1602]MCS1352310.1 manganese efflux pump MntP family protein [Mechercharimyces sp. CAU 1602]